MTDEGLDRILARANAASPGPWRHTPAPGPKDYPCVRGAEPGVEIAVLDTEEDAAFIAAARTDVPALVTYARDRRDAHLGLLEAHAELKAEAAALRQEKAEAAAEAERLREEVRAWKREAERLQYGYVD